MVIQLKDESLFISCDDKAKVDFGEPGYVLATEVRGKKSIAPGGTKISALDHDVNSKGSITPSVTIITQIPDDITGSFYRGKTPRHCMIRNGSS